MPFIGNKPSAVPLTSADITDGIITSAKIADGTIVNADINATSAITLNKLSGNPNFRNRIINGDMTIDQRNAGASINNINGAGLYSVDRWNPYGNQASKYSIQQNAGAVTPPAGFNYYLGITSLSAYTVGASEEFSINQYIEGYNVADLDFGNANAKTITLSFWVRSSLTGTFGGSIRNSVGNRSHPYSYTISSSNTWEYKTITITGDTTGTWLKTNGAGFLVGWSLGNGSNNQGTAGAWTAGNKTAPTGETRIVATSGATFYITGVQLEAGTNATDFEHLPIEITRQRCYRYFQFYPLVFHTAIAGLFADTGGLWTPDFYYPNGEMRVAPSVNYIDEVNNVSKVSTMNPNTANNFNTDNVSAFVNYHTKNKFIWNSYNTGYGIQNPHTGLILVQNLKLSAEY